ncbi:MAG: threonylcarbamoyl-AMP synthase [Acholeplasmatales bacterium]|nr:threonylcarbamoyl-AMP synthase [Acholeplasmatales bacterium]
MNKVIIFPTDTVYGIGCDIFDLEGIERIYKIKNRSKDKPLACLCADIKQIEDIAYLSEDARKLINLFLPGPLTIILKSKPIVLDKIGYKTIGVRIPNNKIALDILKEHGPMLTTSVNESGNVPLNEYDDIKANYNHLVDYIYNTNTKSSNISSTVVDLTDNRLRILRIGEIPLLSIEKALNI